jgi:signal transduction histidine kinase
MWSQLTALFVRGHIQHHRIHGAALVVLLVRLGEGAASWTILRWFFREAISPPWALHVTFIAYACANLGLFTLHRREALTQGLVWLDIAVNLLPMGMALYWSGGVYSPLLPVFVIKIGSYGLIYGADVGLQSLAATGLIAAILAVCEQLGWAPTASVEQVSQIVRQRLTLAFAGLIFAVGCGGALRFFRILQDREARLAEALAEKGRLYQESLLHERHLRQLSRRMMEVSERTMRHVARELHDDLGQALTAVRIDLGLIDRELPGNSQARAQVQQVREQISTALQGMRNLSQLLRPPVLDDLGLVAAIQSFVSRFGARTEIDVRLQVPPAETRLPRVIEVALYRALQEALTNVARHAGAHQVSIQLIVDGDVATLEIRDDGCGFDASGFVHNPPDDSGMGILGMRERVATYGGRFIIESQPGAGTRVELMIPLAAATAEPEEGHGEDSRLVG